MEPKTYPDGVTSWIDTEQRDLEAAQRFYGGLFGWTFTEATPPGAPVRYVVAQRDGLDVAGLSGQAGPGASTVAGAQDEGAVDEGRQGSSSTWNTYVAVSDADAAAARVRASGGRVLEAPSDAQRRWLADGMPKVVLRCESEAALLELQALAERAHVPVAQIQERPVV